MAYFWRYPHIPWQIWEKTRFKNFSSYCIWYTPADGRQEHQLYSWDPSEMQNSITQCPLSSLHRDHPQAWSLHREQGDQSKMQTATSLHCLLVAASMSVVTILVILVMVKVISVTSLISSSSSIKHPIGNPLWPIVHDQWSWTEVCIIHHAKKSKDVTFGILGQFEMCKSAVFPFFINSRQNWLFQMFPVHIAYWAGGVSDNACRAHPSCLWFHIEGEYMHSFRLSKCYCYTSYPHIT